MNVLVCVKRVAATGAQIVLTEDGTSIDTRHLGFTIGPHEECAVEEAVRIVERLGGSVTVLTAGPADAAEQLRYTLAMGADAGVLVDVGAAELDPQATARAVVDGITQLTADGTEFDLVLVGNESADAGHYQVGVRVACALGLPIVGGIKGIDVDVETGHVLLHREIADGTEVYRTPLPAAAAVKEGLNLPRYPSVKGRIKAKKAPIHTVTPEVSAGGLRTVQLRTPRDERPETVVLGHGPEAAGAVVDVLEEMGVA